MSDNDQPTYGAYRPGGDAGPAATGAPYTPGGAQMPPQMQNLPPVPVQKLPGRGLPITLIVLGALIALIAAPIAGFIGTVSSFVSDANLTDLAQQGDADREPIEGPQTVEATDGSAIFLLAKGDGDVACTMLAPDGTELTPQSTQTAEGDIHTVTYVAETSGAYTADCVASDGSPALIHAGKVSLDSITSGALMPAFTTFAIGLALLIGGIVWLVKRNRARREIIARTGY